MESEDHHESWPVIGQSDVADVCREVCESVVELERAFEAGELPSRLVSSGFERILGPLLYNTYRKLADTSPGPLQHLRGSAVRTFLVQLRNDLVPCQVAQAQVRTPPEGSSDTGEPGTGSRPRFPFQLADASFDGTMTTTLRLDQMLDVRFWGIGFTFQTLHLCDAFSRVVVRDVTRRLASGLLDLQRILERFTHKAPIEELKIVPLPSERRFEHLMLDILNENERHAKLAPLLEDFLEKTDLRVHYTGLRRRRGARVQVTSIIAPDLHEAKLQAIKLAEEFVFLSPLSLAEFVDSLRGRSPVGSISGAASFTSAPLWDCLEMKPADVPQLASELKRIMLRALTGTPDSPLGPMVRVPPPIRQLIRVFVETRAIASTNRLREREKGIFSDGPWIEIGFNRPLRSERDES